MKNITLIITVAFALMLISCTNTKEPKETNTDTTKTKRPEPLNISIYLDLSDRINPKARPDLKYSQMERDTAVINMIVDKFNNRCKEGTVNDAQHHIKVIFYPIPDSKDITEYAAAMEVDMANLDNGRKKKAVMEMKEKFNSAVAKIYKEALDEENWPGSDIWGFFSDMKVDDLCMRKGYRNILVILTDGYLYYEKNKKEEGDHGHSFVLSETLRDKDSYLICKRKGLGDLEVLMLEVNPYPNDESLKNKLHSVLEGWLTNMEVGKYKIVETDLPNNTAVYIDNFFKE